MFTVNEIESFNFRSLNWIKEKYFITYNESHTTSIRVALQNFLNVLSMNPSLNYFKFLIETLIKTPYGYEHLILEDALKLYMNNIKNNVKEQIEILQLVHEMCFDFNNFTNNERYNVTKNILVPLLQAASYSSLSNFYKDTIQGVINIMDVQEMNDDRTITSKTINFILIENIFSDLDINKDSIITDSFPDFKKTCYRNCLLASSLDVSNVDEELLRLFHCHAYNALTSVICNTQSNATSLCQAIFPWNKDTLWKRILDHKKTYTFEYNSTNVKKSKEIVTGIRDQIKINRRMTDPSFKTQRYIESQSLFRSSLNPSFHRYDFTNAALREEFAFTEDSILKTEIVLKTIDINSHECMATLCAVIKHFADCENMEDVLIKSLPEWASCILKILTEGVHSNQTKIFFAKLIENMKDIFKYYEKWFTEPIIKLITNGVIGNDINRFTSELVSKICFFKYILRFFKISNSCKYNFMIA